MNKKEYLEAVRVKIVGLPLNEVEKSLDFYGEMIDDRVEEGATEDEAVLQIPSPSEAAEKIISGVSILTLAREKARPKSPLRTWEIVLLAVGSVLWVPLLIAIVSAFCAVYVSIWAVIVSLYAVVLAFFAAGIAGVIGGAVSLAGGDVVRFMLMLGSGLILVGIAALLLIAFTRLSVLLVSVSRRFVLWIKSMFLGKGEKK